MTFVEVILVGFGALLVVSALENKPLVQTFQAIIKNQPLDFSNLPLGASASTPTSSSTTGNNPPMQTVTL
jgi:hypothetical protein